MPGLPPRILQWIGYIHALRAILQCQVCCIFITQSIPIHLTTSDDIWIFQNTFFKI